MNKLKKKQEHLHSFLFTNRHNTKMAKKNYKIQHKPEYKARFSLILVIAAQKNKGHFISEAVTDSFE